ncbi:MAG: biotin--[acetyl-CoA-carboxylase] ligase [Thermomicrobiales bacterium]
MIQLGSPIYRFDSVLSTMDELDRLARNGAPEGAAVIAAVQEQGRGRAGRAWVTVPGSAFLCSVLLRPDLVAREISSLPLIAGLAIAEAIELIGGVACKLKWPNDILVNEKKICGVLMQSRSVGERVEFANLGFGVNLNSTIVEIPPTATSLQIETGLQIDFATFEQAVFSRLSARYAEFLEAGGKPSLQGWVDRALFLGESVEIGQPQGVLRGRFIGVSPDGALRLETELGVKDVAIGELTRGPRAAYGMSTPK